MPQDHRLQTQRFELKYLVPESLTPKIRSFIRPYLELDEFGAGSPEFGYCVHSIYLDSDDMQTYHWTLNGDDDRFKLRIRYYDDRGDGPVFFETKRRLNDCVLKERCAIQRKAARLVLDGHIPDESAFLSTTARHLKNLQKFSYLMTNLRARPKAHVAYLREAWVSPNDNSMRLTMDRQTSCEPSPELRFRSETQEPFRVFGGDVVLELKFTHRFPRWCKEMVEAFELAQCGAAKYAWGVEQLGEARFAEMASSFAEESQTATEVRRGASAVNKPAILEPAHFGILEGAA